MTEEIAAVTKEPHAGPVPPDGPPSESFAVVPPADDTLPAPRTTSTGPRSDLLGQGWSGEEPEVGGGLDGRGAGNRLRLRPSSAAAASDSARGGAAASDSAGGGVPAADIDPAQLETVPGRAVAPAGQGRPVRVGRGTGRLSRRLVIAYFAAGLALLLAGTVAVFYLAIKVYAPAVPEAQVTATREFPSAAPSHAPSPPARVEPSTPLRARFGPQQLANGKPFVMRGEGDSKFQITVKAGKFRRSGCDPYAVKPEEGGYLPVKLTLKVLQGEPEVSEYAFRFQKPDGDWLPSVGGSGCDGRDYGGFFRRLSAGRTYTSSVVFDVPSAKGDIVFVYPLMDVVAAWKVR
ncbi:hypothetical protein AB0J80_18145 [Actinoplanes sp. NPDC049548]|uniref:hypothetical protein n=1 Tax=Actinoplanes sp. NPDC049548 TaxID=3155152 RepID=UPI003428F837